MKKLKEIFSVEKPIIGMIHLLPLPGYGDHPGMSSDVQDKDLETGRSGRTGRDLITAKNC